MLAYTLSLPYGSHHRQRSAWLKRARACPQAAGALGNQTLLTTNVTLLYVLQCTAGQCLKLNPYASGASAAAPALASLAAAAAAMFVAFLI